MGKVKLKKLGNFLLITDIDSNFELRCSTIDTTYSFNNENVVLILESIAEGFIYRYNITDLIDELNVAYTKTTLDSFLSAFLGVRSSTTDTTGINGTTPYKLISLATTNANVVKATPGNLYSIVAIGLTSIVRYLKLYNKASAPTVGTDVPVMTIPIPANTQGAGIAIPFSMGVNFPLGIALAITTGSADNNNVAVAAGDIIINLTYA